MTTRFVVGIDLGTTNCAVAAVDTAQEMPQAEHVTITQVVGPGEVAARATMPSSLLLPAAHEVAPEAMALPWTGPAPFAVGAFAQSRGAELPHRLVSSAKSWLSSSHIDRGAAIL
ncbi:MAG: Hsp70 family protein, partial [Deltaproteobacteria bacterium]|nr:Hsp70 family protein [Kofleriaceae bacterium]